MQAIPNKAKMRQNKKQVQPADVFTSLLDLPRVTYYSCYYKTKELFFIEVD